MSAFHSLNVEEGWAQQQRQPSSSSSSPNASNPKPSTSSSTPRKKLLLFLLGSLLFAAVFAGALAVLRSSDRGREGGVLYPSRPLSEASPLPPLPSQKTTRAAASALNDDASNSNSSSPLPPPPLRFLVIGDWGRRGNSAQREVADAMTRRVREVREAAAAATGKSSSSSFHPSFLAAGSSGPEFVLSVGDNFYQSGLLSPEDSAFDESFVDVYSSPELVKKRERKRERVNLFFSLLSFVCSLVFIPNSHPFLFFSPSFFLKQAVPWLGVLGNHDYGELKPTKAEKKKLKKEKKKKQEEKEEEEDKEEEDDGDDDDDDDLPPPRPSAELCAAATALGSSSSCSYGPLSQLDARLPDRDPRWRISRAFNLRLRSANDDATGGVSLSGFDTSPLVKKYHKESWARVPGGIRDQKGAALAGLRELEASIEREKREGMKWRLAVAHHPFASLASPLRTPELDHLLARPLRSSSVVFAGHDHTMQFLRWPAVAPAAAARDEKSNERFRPPVIVSGGGSEVGGADRVNSSAVSAGSIFFPAGTDAFFARRRGFADCVVTREELRCDLVGADGAVLFTAVVPSGEEKRKRAPPPPPPPPQAAAGAGAAAGTPTPHSPPDDTRVVSEPEEEEQKPQAAAEETQQQQEEPLDAPLRPPPVPHLRRH